MKKAQTQSMIIGVIISIIVLVLFLGGLYLTASGKLDGLLDTLRGFFRGA